MLPIKFEGFRFAEKGEIMLLVFHSNASKNSSETRPGITDKYIKMKILICGFLTETTFLKFDRLTVLAINNYL